MNKPHKHAELIKAWADGAEIEMRSRGDSYYKWTHWYEFAGDWFEDDDTEYRIKPEPKPDVVKYITATKGDEMFKATFCRWKRDNVKLTFDGETGELKSAEVLK